MSIIEKTGEFMHLVESGLADFADEHGNTVMSGAIRRHVSSFIEQIADFRERRQFRISKIEEVRHNMYDLFSQMTRPQEGEDVPMLHYRSVSNCDSPSYFNRPVIDTIDRQFFLVVNELSNDMRANLDRIVLFPPEKWPSPDTLPFWKNIFETTASRVEACRDNPNINIQIVFVPLSEAKKRHLDTRKLDFGIYSPKEAGIYERYKKTETLTLHFANPGFVETLECFWRELSYPDEFLSFQDLKRELDICDTRSMECEQ